MIEAKGGTVKIRQNRQSRETGAVSLFVVMFTAMLFAAVTVGFTVLMLSDQQQSTDNDLAQSALDSANAGAEDAKRVLAQYTDCVESNTTGTPACQNIISAVGSNDCSTIQAATGEDQSKERSIKITEDDSALEQAYTCVKITPNTDDYVGTTRTEGDIRLIPIKTDGEPVDTVTVQWLSPTDLGVDNISDADLSKPDDKTVSGSQTGQRAIELPQRGDWRDANRGALLRVGSIQYQPGNIDLDEIDRQARAVFLYPEETLIADSNTVNFATEDNHQPLTDMVAPADATPNKPQPSNCRTGGSGGYLCETIFKLPPGDASTFRYLTIASLYRDTSFRVTLKNAGGTVQFRNVQPQVDVTGRANDVFRRIVSRVESADASEAPYPRAALGSLGDICKHYLITDDPDDYRPQGDLDCSTAGAIADPEAPLPATP